MARYTSPSEVNWSQGVGTMFESVNTATSGLVSALFILAVGFLVAGGYFLSRREPLEAISVGSFVAWVICIFMFSAQFVHWSIMAISTTIMILAFAFLHADRN